MILLTPGPGGRLEEVHPHQDVAVEDLRRLGHADPQPAVVGRRVDDGVGTQALDGPAGHRGVQHVELGAARGRHVVSVASQGLGDPASEETAPTRQQHALRHDCLLHEVRHSRGARGRRHAEDLEVHPETIHSRPVYECEDCNDHGRPKPQREDASTGGREPESASRRAPYLGDQSNTEASKRVQTTVDPESSNAGQTAPTVPFKSPTYPPRVHFHERAELEERLRSCEERLQADPAKAGYAGEPPAEGGP